MPAQAPTYDLVMLLDPDAEEPARTRPLSEAQDAIKANGELLRHDAWGNRQLTYPIHHRAAGEYHLLQFHSSTPELLQTLDRSLRLADEVLRFRIIKLRPGTPDAPEMRAPAPPPRRAPDAPAVPPTAPQPDAAAPQPDAAAPQPDAAAPQPDAAAPQPDAAAPPPSSPPAPAAEQATDAPPDEEAQVAPDGDAQA
jgi:small subunit ribosomal protein S6